MGDSAFERDDCFHGICSELDFFAVEIAVIAEVVEVVGIAVGDAPESPDRPMNVVVATCLEKSHSLVEEPCLVHLVAD